MLTGNWMTDRLDARRFRLGRPQTLSVFGNPENLPAHIIDNLERAKRDRGPFGLRASVQGWVETLSSPTSDGTQILNTVTETIMVPDFTLPANYMVQGRTLKYTLFFDTSTVITTPGTVTLKLRWGGVAGTTLATSGAYAPDPTAASTNQSGYVEWFLVARAAPSASASSYTMGRCWLGDLDDASATSLQGNLNMHVIPASAPAAVNIATNAANAITPTCTFSVSTATSQLTNHIAVLESLN
jgi:hypothetical protein